MVGPTRARMQRLIAEDGQGLAEYALALAIVAIVVIVALLLMGSQVSGVLSTVSGPV